MQGYSAKFLIKNIGIFMIENKQLREDKNKLRAEIKLLKNKIKAYQNEKKAI